MTGLAIVYIGRQGKQLTSIHHPVCTKHYLLASMLHIWSKYRSMTGTVESSFYRRGNNSERFRKFPSFVKQVFDVARIGNQVCVPSSCFSACTDEGN